MPSQYFKNLNNTKINSLNFIQNIRTGLITELQLVEMFGTKKQLNKYKENNRFTSLNKKTVLENANRYCDIEDKKNKQYEIKQVYSYVRPKELNKMKESLYQYIIPLLLINLFKSEDNKIKLAIGQYARMIEMVNQNYGFLKTQIKYANTPEERKTILKATSIDYIEIMSDFYNKTDDMVEMYIERALEYLDKTGFIKVSNIHMICEEVVDNSNIIDGSGNIVTKIKINNRQSTEQERDFEVECIRNADIEANIDIKNKTERYFGKKASMWQKSVNKQLRKRNIKFFYYTYEIRVINSNSVKLLYKEYPKIKEKDLIEAFTSQVIKNIMVNADNRFDNLKNRITNSKEDYLLNFSNMCDITISPVIYEDKDLRNRLKNVSNDKKYNQNIKIEYTKEN